MAGTLRAATLLSCVVATVCLRSPNDEPLTAPPLSSSREKLPAHARLPDLDVLYTSEGTEAGNFLRGLKGTTFGLAMKWKPRHRRDAPPRAALLMIAAGPRVLLFDLVPWRKFAATRLPDSVTNFLREERHIFYGRDILEVVARLAFEFDVLVDAIDFEARSWPRMVLGSSLMEQSRLLLGTQVNESEEVERSDWDWRPLWTEQLTYAAEVAYLHWAIADHFIKKHEQAHASWTLKRSEIFRYGMKRVWRCNRVERPTIDWSPEMEGLISWQEEDGVKGTRISIVQRNGFPQLDVLLTRDEQAVRAVLEEWSAVKHFGLEFKTNYYIYKPRLFLSLAVGPRVLIIDLLPFGQMVTKPDKYRVEPMPEALVSFLSDRHRVFYGLNIAAGAGLLVSEFGCKPNIIDFSRRGWRFMSQSGGLQGMATRYLGMTLDPNHNKESAHSNFDRHRLLHGQVRYLAERVYLYWALADHFLTKTGHTQAEWVLAARELRLAGDGRELEWQVPIAAERSQRMSDDEEEWEGDEELEEEVFDDVPETGELLPAYDPWENRGRRQRRRSDGSVVRRRTDGSVARSRSTARTRGSSVHTRRSGGSDKDAQELGSSALPTPRRRVNMENFRNEIMATQDVEMLTNSALRSPRPRTGLQAAQDVKMLENAALRAPRARSSLQAATQDVEMLENAALRAPRARSSLQAAAQDVDMLEKAALRAPRARTSLQAAAQEPMRAPKRRATVQRTGYEVGAPEESAPRQRSRSRPRWRGNERKQTLQQHSYEITSAGTEKQLSGPLAASRGDTQEVGDNRRSGRRQATMQRTNYEVGEPEEPDAKLGSALSAPRQRGRSRPHSRGSERKQTLQQQSYEITSADTENKVSGPLAASRGDAQKVGDKRRSDKEANMDIDDDGGMRPRGYIVNELRNLALG